MLRVSRFIGRGGRAGPGYNLHFARNARTKQVRRDGRTMGLEKVNSRLMYSYKVDVLQPAKTEMLPLAKVDIPLLVESSHRDLYIRL